MSHWFDPLGQSRPDFWELTNFRPTPIDLSGYRFKDANVPEIGVEVNDGVEIAGGESIVFVRRQTSDQFDEATFCAWWGLTPCPQIIFFDGFGFNNVGEELWLWDKQTNLVDYVVFDEARRNVTFTFENRCGRNGELSEIGVCGAVRATDSDGIGSPGKALCGPFPLAVFPQPPPQVVVDAGADVTLHLEACGLPRPRVQWFFNGVPRSSGSSAQASIPAVVNYAGSGLAWTAVANPADLVIPRATLADAGQYVAVLDNGLERATGAVVALTVLTNRSPPHIESPAPEFRWPLLDGRPQTNLVAAPGQTARFGVIARGYPLPTFEWSWSSDGVQFTRLDGETNRTLAIANAQAANAGTYRVRVANERGSTNVSAYLSIKAKPRLRITEVMNGPCDPQDPTWWELTNTGDEPVQLCCHRWDDSPGAIGGGPTVTNVISIEAGESIIFLEDETTNSFVRHWGTDDLPPNQRFILYSANGLNADGDEVNLWNPFATNPEDPADAPIDSVVFYRATPGHSFWFDLEGCLTSEFGAVSSEGVCGAFRPAESCEVGSPGWTRWTRPRLTSVQRQGASAVLTWKAQPGSTNRLEFARRLASPPAATAWENMGTYHSPNVTYTATDSTIGGDAQRFYRVVRVAPAGCPCPDPIEFATP